MSQQLHTHQSRPPSPSEDHKTAKLFAPILSALDSRQLPFLAKSVLQAQQIRDVPEPSADDPILDPTVPPSQFLLTTARGELLRSRFMASKACVTNCPAPHLPPRPRGCGLLRRKTSMPVPDVFDFSLITENLLRCSYITMSFVKGSRSMISGSATA